MQSNTCGGGHSQTLGILLLGTALAGSLFTGCSNARATFDKGGASTHTTDDEDGSRSPLDAGNDERGPATDGGVSDHLPSTSTAALPDSMNTPGASPVNSEMLAPTPTGPSSPPTSSASTAPSVSSSPEPSLQPSPDVIPEPSPDAMPKPSAPETSSTSPGETVEVPAAPGADDSDASDDSESAPPPGVPPSTDAGAVDSPGIPSCAPEACADVAPVVIAQVPAKDAKGVEADQAIEITFSKPMDRASVESALTLSGVSASARSSSWDDAGQVLTLTPDAPLQYAKGFVLASEARSYTVSVGIAARDLDGHRLAAPHTSSFTTLRDLQIRIAPKKAAQLSTSAAASGAAPSLCNGDSELYVGWTGTNAAKDTTYIFAQIDPSELGSADAVAEFKSAKFFAQHGTPTANYYDMGSVNLDSVAYGPIDSSLVSRSVRETQLLADSTDPYNPSADIGEEFLSSWEDGDSLLYRLSPKDSAVDERALFECYGMFVEVEYLAP